MISIHNVYDSSMLTGDSVSRRIALKGRYNNSVSGGCMKKKAMVVLVVMISICYGCASAGLNTAQKVNELKVGMSEAEVTGLLGSPKTTQAVEGKKVLKYSLHEYWKGWVPYYMVFDAGNRLESWYADEKEYQENQKRMEETFAPLLAAPSAGQSKAAPPGPNDPQLQQWIAGYYYSYTGGGTAGTERKLMLCPNGRFRFASESSYSANTNMDGTTDWGAVSTDQNGGTWTITGNQQQGTLTLNFNNGDIFNYPYRAGSDKGSFHINNILFGYAGPPKCD